MSISAHSPLSSSKHPVEVIAETTQDFETIVICSHTDQLVSAPLAAFQLKHQQEQNAFLMQTKRSETNRAASPSSSSAASARRAGGEESSNGNNSSRSRRASSVTPSERLLSLGVGSSGGQIRPADLDGPNVCAPVTPFDEERFRHFIKQMLTVHRHYFETNRSPRAAQQERLTSCTRRRHVAVLTDHMTQAQRERLAIDIRTKVVEATPSTDKRVLELIFFTKNPDANARGREYLRASVPNTADIQSVAAIQARYITQCANPYNHAKAEMLMMQSEESRLGRQRDRYESAMKDVRPVGAFEVRSNVNITNASGPTSATRTRGGSMQNSPRRAAHSGGLNTTAVTSLENGDGGERERQLSFQQQLGAVASITRKSSHKNVNGKGPYSKGGGGDLSSEDSDDDLTIPLNVATNEAFIKAVTGGAGGASAASAAAVSLRRGSLALSQGVASTNHNNNATVHHGPNEFSTGSLEFNTRTREGLFASLGLGGPLVVYPEGKITIPSSSSHAYAYTSSASLLGTNASSDAASGVGSSPRGVREGTNRDKSNTLTAVDLEQRLSRASGLHAKEVAKASIVLVAEDVRKRAGLDGAMSARGPSTRSVGVNESNTPVSARQVARTSSSFLPSLVDPNAAIVMGEISAFTKGRFDKRTGAYSGPYSSGGQSAFANSDLADHTQSGRRRSLFGQSFMSSSANGSLTSLPANDGGDPKKGSQKSKATNLDELRVTSDNTTGMGKSGVVVANGDEKNLPSPRHAKFLVSRTPFAASGVAGSGGQSNSHTTNLLVNAFLFTSLFEQVNGVGSLSPLQQQEQREQENGTRFFGSSGPAVGSVASAVCSPLANTACPVTASAKRQLMHRLLDIHGETVVRGTLRNAQMLSALLEANRAGIDGLNPSGLGGSAGGGGGIMSNNFNPSSSSPAELTLADFFVTLLAPQPIELTRVGAGGLISGYLEMNKTISRSNLGPVTDTSLSSGQPSAELRLSPAKAAAIADTVSTFAAKPPSAPVTSLVGEEITTMYVTKSGRYHFRTISQSPRRGEEERAQSSSKNSPRKRDGDEKRAVEATASTPQRSTVVSSSLTPIRQHLKKVIRDGNAVVDDGKEKDHERNEEGSTATKRIPAPPGYSGLSPSSPAATATASRRPSLPSGMPRTLYSSSYHDAITSHIFAAAGGGTKRRGEIVNIAANSSNSTSNGYSNSGYSRSGGAELFDPSCLAIVRPFDQFFRVYDPELSGTVRRDSFVLALLAASAAATASSMAVASSKSSDVSPPSLGSSVCSSSARSGRRSSQTNTIRKDARSAISFTVLWVIAMLLQQPATSDDIKLGELFALRDLVRNVCLREARHAETDKALRRLQQTIRLLTNKEEEEVGRRSGDEKTKESDEETRLSKSNALPSSSGRYGSSFPHVLLCLEHAAEHGIDSHQLVGYGELAVTLSAALVEDEVAGRC